MITYRRMSQTQLIDLLNVLIFIYNEIIREYVLET